MAQDGAERIAERILAGGGALCACLSVGAAYATAAELARVFAAGSWRQYAPAPRGEKLFRVILRPADCSFTLVPAKAGTQLVA